MGKKFGDRLREARERRGLSQAELANRAGFQPSAISHFETDKRSPSFENLKKLADALEVSTDYLLGRKTLHDISGPVVDKILRNLSNMSAADQEALADMASILARKKLGEKNNNK